MDCNSHNIPKIRLIARQAGPGSIQLDLNTATFKLLTSSPYNLTIENSLSAFVGAPDSLNNKVVISDSTVNINKSDGSLINSVNVPAEDLDSYNVADSAITVLNSLSNVVDSGNVKATESGNFTAPDGTYENSDSTFTDSVASGELNKLIPDIDLSVNSVVEGSVPSVKDIDIELEDSLSNPITPTSVTMVGDVLTIEVPGGGGSEYRHEWDDPYSYCGLAGSGTPESSPTWTITRIEVFLDGTTDIKTATGAWTDRLILIYT
jgi:hypothetical protein